MADAFGQRLVPGLGLDDCQLAIAMDEDVVGGELRAAVAMALDAAWRDRVLAKDATTLDQTPAHRRQSGIDVLGSGLRFVHAAFFVSRPLNASFRRDVFSSSSMPSLRR